MYRGSTRTCQGYIQKYHAPTRSCRALKQIIRLIFGFCGRIIDINNRSPFFGIDGIILTFAVQKKNISLS
jgi:hypothetical protein